MIIAPNLISALKPLLVAGISFTTVILLLQWMLKSSTLKLVVDEPNHRSLHKTPVPRIGGLAIMSGVLISWGLIWQHWIIPFLLSSVVLVILSFIDDIRDLSVIWRIFWQLVVAALFVATTFAFTPIWIISILTVCLVWVTNLFNFMDGSDGLAGGMAMFGFGTYSAAAWLSGDYSLSYVSLCIVAASMAFLWFNFHPARIFMGDSGSIPLGFLSAALGLMGWKHNLWPLWLPVLVFSPFIIDATITMAKRLVKGEKIWQAHRSHYYQRLVLMGWGHRKTACAEYVLMMLAGLTAILLLGISPSGQFLGLIVWCVIYCILAWKIDSMWSRYKCESMP
jgi:UDP-N-acetylmuramyl pentapeptide phosphotransferase/UDP-N-acetylglucosamine-1-phosphate transferase